MSLRYCPCQQPKVQAGDFWRVQQGEPHRSAENGGKLGQANHVRSEGSNDQRLGDRMAGWRYALATPIPATSSRATNSRAFTIFNTK
jgi:hypothetical protein